MDDLYERLARHVGRALAERWMVVLNRGREQRKINKQEGQSAARGVEAERAGADAAQAATRKANSQKAVNSCAPLRST